MGQKRGGLGSRTRTNKTVLIPMTISPSWNVRDFWIWGEPHRPYTYETWITCSAKAEHHRADQTTASQTSVYYLGYPRYRLQTQIQQHSRMFDQRLSRTAKQENYTVQTWHILQTLWQMPWAFTNVSETKMNHTILKGCSKCFEYDDVCGHDSIEREYQCGICLTITSSELQAKRCCSNLVNNEPLPATCFAKEKKTKWFPKPDNRSQYGTRS